MNGIDAIDQERDTGGRGRRSLIDWQLEAATDPSDGRLHRRAQLYESGEQRQMVEAAVARAKDGDEVALRFLYSRYAGNVYGYVSSLIRDEHEAEDLTQQLFAKLMVALGKYEPRGLPFSAWILTVARNLALDHMRSRRTVPSEETVEIGTHDDSERHHHVRSLREALGSLPEDQREVLYLRHVMGLSPGEIAERLDKSEGSIHGLHHRGRRTLRASLVALDSAPSTLRSRAWKPRVAVQAA